MTEQRSKTTLGAVIWRFLAGKHLDGKTRTDCTFVRRGTRPLTVHGHASPWAMLAGWSRTAWRLGIAAGAAGIAYGLWKAPAYTYAGITCVGAAGGYVLHRRYTRKILHWRHRRHTVIPLHHTFSSLLGYSPLAETPESRLIVPRDCRSNPKARVRIKLPVDWIGNDGHKKEMTKIVSRRLGGEWLPDWRQTEHPPYVDFRPMPKPPGRVTLADVRTDMLRAADDELTLGLPARPDPYRIKLTEPHVALSIRTGGGKTTILRGLIAQGIRKGWHNEIIDPKFVSLNEFSGMVPIHRSVESQMKAIKAFREEMDLRYRDLGESDAEYEGQRWVLWIEEGNSFISDLEEYWTEYRNSLDAKERAVTPKKNPAIADFRFIIFKGRAVKMHIVSVFQRMSGNAVPGGGDIREQFGTKLINASPSTWMMVIGTRPAPKPSKIKGRVIAVVGEDEIPVQTAYLEKAEAREYALADSETPDEPLADVISMMERGERFTLKQACEADIIPMRYGAARRARARDREFPAGMRLTYTADELRTWYGNRKRARQIAA